MYLSTFENDGFLCKILYIVINSLELQLYNMSQKKVIMVKKGVKNMARKGENIRKRKDGRWEGRYHILENGILKTKSVYAHTYKDVKIKLLECKVASPNLYQEPVAVITVHEAAIKWIMLLPEHYKPATCTKYKEIYEQHVQPIFGELKLANLTNEYIKTHLNPFLSQSLTRSIYSVLNHIYMYGVQIYHLEERKFVQDNPRRTSRTIDVLDLSEQARLLTYLHKDIDIYKLGIYICLSTGLRLGEVCALKWSDIDMNLKLLHVNQTVQRLSSEDGESKTILVETSPKSFHSKREIPLSNQLYTLLKEFQSTDTYVLNGNSPMEPRTLQYKFDKYLQEANVRKTNFHTLRHTFWLFAIIL